MGVGAAGKERKGGLAIWRGVGQVRGQNTFMRRVLAMHAVTMVLLLGGMFGLSMTAIELSKETKVSTGGAIVTPTGQPVTVASSDVSITDHRVVPHSAADGRRLDGDGTTPVLSETLHMVAEQVTLDLTGVSRRGRGGSGPGRTGRACRRAGLGL